MDPSIYLQYTTPNGLPQESKLATYMNHSATPPTQSLTHALGNLSIDASPMDNVMVNEFVPMNYFSTPPTLLTSSPKNPSPSTIASVPSTQQVHQECVGGTTYFYSTNDSLAMNSSAGLNSSVPLDGCMVAPVVPGPILASPYATQLYHATANPMVPMSSQSGLAAVYYMPQTIRSEIYQRNENFYSIQPDPTLEYEDLGETPENLEMYSELTPLDGSNPHSATTYRGIHRETGECFAIRRLHGFSSLANKHLETWKQLDHPNIVQFHEYFTTQAFGDLSLILVYQYHPACISMMDKYLTVSGGSVSDANGVYHDPFSSDPDAPRPYTYQKNAMLRAMANGGALLPEAVLWSILVQLTAALRAIHAAGLACRVLDPSKVIVNGCRVRIAWCGGTDALLTNTNDVTQAQQDDLTALGQLALSLACRTIQCENVPTSMDVVSKTYSADLKNFIMYLLTTSNPRRSVTDLMPMIGARFFTQIEALERRGDVVEDQLAQEIDNGRIVRMIIKLGVVNERPELNMDPAWSETGDRYMLKLFRDHLFHAVTEDGTPWLDQAHLTYCLNQLASGSNAEVELMSRDEQSVLVVTYKELKHCLDQTFEEVLQLSTNGLN